MKKKHPLTLMEIMIVICLIGIVASVIGFNMKGSLDKGKKFKTEHAAAQIKDILLMELAEKNGDPAAVAARWEAIIKDSPIPRKPDDLLKDGWGNAFEVTYDAQNHDYIVYSARYQDELPKTETLKNGASKEQ